MGQRREYWRTLGVESQDLIKLSQWNDWIAVEMESDLHSDAGGPSAFDLVFVSEQCNTSSPSPIIKSTFTAIRKQKIDPQTGTHHG